MWYSPVVSFSQGTQYHRERLQEGALGLSTDNYGYETVVSTDIWVCITAKSLLGCVNINYRKASMATAEKDTTKVAQARFVVSLPAEVGLQIDEVGAKLRAALERETGIGFEMSRAQIVQALVRQQLKDSAAEKVAES